MQGNPPSHLAHYQKAYAKFPEKIIDLDIDTLIFWIYETKKKTLSNQLIGFRISKPSAFAEFFASSLIIESIKESFQQHLFQLNMQSQYKIIQLLATGSCSTVQAVIVY